MEAGGALQSSLFELRPDKSLRGEKIKGMGIFSVDFTL
jgi:hypothetical protein